MFTDKPNNKTIYEYILRTAIIIFVLCAALLKAVAFTPEADNGYIPTVQSDTEKSQKSATFLGSITIRFITTVKHTKPAYL